MTPCTRCHGSGTEPAARETALAELGAAAAAIASGAQSDAELTRQGTRLITAIEIYRGLCAARIVFLEAALRDVLGRIDPPGQMRGTYQILQVPNDVIADWRKILDGEQ